MFFIFMILALIHFFFFLSLNILLILIHEKVLFLLSLISILYHLNYFLVIPNFLNFDLKINIHINIIDLLYYNLLPISPKLLLYISRHSRF